MSQQVQEIRWIDKFGNLYEGSNAIGFFDSVTGKCFDFNDNELPCPDYSKDDIQQPTIKAAQSYWWVLLIFFVLAVIALAYYINR